ncbi:hypothetical protein HU675_0035400 [Bradyrhizobium septentrionale]|uniref:hypothetical protein n=1 Tax=Bradyrhizobium septentrionale TaxID=1404411 RepID=UPI001596994C|nr:hypothetical protein [Bradyrhizobium septentrionale]UGY23205.1 hypothetical protein HU675_0035400 [Bradyrhizobium septentrionale]
MTDKIALFRQIAAVEAEIKDRSAGARSRLDRSASQRQCDGLEAGAKTLRWLLQNEARINAACALMAGAISMTRQITAVETELKDRRSGARAKLSSAAAIYQRDGLETAANTLRRLQQNEASIKGALRQ